MFTPEAVAAKKAAAAALLNLNPDRIYVHPGNLDVYRDDDFRQPVRRRKFQIIALKAMLMEWTGWGGEPDLTSKLLRQHPRLRRMLESIDRIAVAALAVRLRGGHGA